MDRTGSSHSVYQNPTYAQVPRKDPESGEGKDNRSCATKAFKWVVRHPFLAAAGTIGLVGVASGGIYGLSLLGAAAPAAVALSDRNMTTAAPTTAAPTTAAPTTAAPTTAAPTTAAPTTAAPTTAAPDHIISFTGENIRLDLPRMDSTARKESGFIAGENTKGVPDSLVWSMATGGTPFTTNLRGSDGENYDVNLIAKLGNHSGCSALYQGMNNAINCGGVAPPYFLMELGDNSHLPQSLSYEGSFTLIRQEWRGPVSESYRFDVSLPSL